MNIREVYYIFGSYRRNIDKFKFVKLKMSNSNKALDKYIEIPEQQISTFNRSGFTVVECGGTEVK